MPGSKHYQITRLPKFVLVIVACLMCIAKPTTRSVDENNKDEREKITKTEGPFKSPDDKESDTTGIPQKIIARPIIRSINISGNTLVATSAIKTKIPFEIGDAFDTRKAATIIKAIYRLGYFTNIQVATEENSSGGINLFITVTEKDRISALTFDGNKNYSTEKLRKKLELSRIRTLDERELINIAEQIKKAYREKSYHHTEVTGTLVPAKDGSKEAHFEIQEGTTTTVKCVKFRGNAHIPDDYLRAQLFTREDWIFGIIDKSGTYHPDAILQDRYTLENLYQSSGFLAARVTDVITDEKTDGTMNITFVIDEGDPYVISKVEAPGNDILSEQQLLASIPLYQGQLYSKNLVRSAMDQLRTIWGEYGYIYADVQPAIRPDEKTKTVEISFRSDLGKCIHVNRIDIVGNFKTIDKVIRREILFDEGDLLTKNLMEESKRRLQLLGYFDQKDGVNWRIIKKDEDEADLELIVKEVGTGRIMCQAGYGMQNDSQSPTGGFSIGGSVSNSNFRGAGIRYGLNGNYAVNSKAVDAFISDEWLFDRPISGSLSAYLRDSIYEDFEQTINEPAERTVGGTLHTGFRVEKLNFMQVGLSLGQEDISYSSSTRAKERFADRALQNSLQLQIDRSFQPGSVLWVGGNLSQDFRDHPTYPSSGYFWNFDTKIGLPYSSSCFSFVKAGIDANWYTPIIQQHGLVFHIHGFGGLIERIKDRAIPYRELFHIGGPMSVRGFNYGQIGPQMLGSSLGGSRAFFLNFELLFPITSDGNMRGWLFYDGGTSWDTPDSNCIPPEFLSNNAFEYRHSVGFGFSVQSPQPIRVDWGFKLDRKKRRGENIMEVHFSSARAF
ncbi:MAG: Outer membrane protein assembly factor BamA [candidate division TM6 bacterium GW2011_GWE2_42_60]|nr:MAG: Outer membrane protein assembly factor BamA [candidate division TM6 bacterium GW2011_GWE2_42_60]HBY05465.1 outer membrane protein assembly factor BamA [Candidatus Dependentiae bacterium]